MLTLCCTSTAASARGSRRAALPSLPRNCDGTQVHFHRATIGNGECACAAQLEWEQTRRAHWSDGQKAELLPTSPTRDVVNGSHDKQVSLYFKDTLIDPVAAGARLLTMPGMMSAIPLAHELFNPAIVALPSVERAVARMVFPTAVYLAALRVLGHQCHLKRVHQPTLDVVRDSKSEKRGTALVLLDADFRVVGSVELTSSGSSKIALSATDMRLDTLPDAVLPGIVATFCTFGFPTFAKRGEWHARRITLQIHAGGVGLSADFSFGTGLRGFPNTTKGYEGTRNIGLVPFASQAFMLMWVSQPLMLFPEGSDQTQQWQHRHLLGCGAQLDHGAPAGGRCKPHPLHNNVSPVMLSGADAGSMLLIAHTHGDYGGGANHRIRYGSVYVHTFLIADAAPPWKVVAQSPEWCIPAFSNPERCETIQFVTTAILSANGTELVLGYGVNDCDSRVLRLPLAQVLKLARGGGPVAEGGLVPQRSSNPEALLG